MKIGAFVASLVFLSCFDVNKSKKHHTLLQCSHHSGATFRRSNGQFGTPYAHGLRTPLRLTGIGYISSATDRRRQRLRRR
ncbi:hypothetical protein V8E52_005289 [Russula decolorans]